MPLAGYTTHMDIEKLTKSQLVLLALLVSFMTSMSTGIVTVALMQQAPPSITQSVSKVIERTIEKAVPATGQSASVAAPVVKTVVVHDAPAAPSLSHAVDTVSPSLVRISSGDRATFLALGIVLTDDGIIATDADSLGVTTSFDLETRSGGHIPMVLSSDNDKGIAFLRPATTTLENWEPVKVGAGNPSLGTSVAALGGKTAVRLAPGVVTAISPFSSDKDSRIKIIETDTAADTILPGSPLIDLNGTVIGISSAAARKNGASSFVSTDVLLVPVSAAATTSVK